jgi:hypothetical protein
VEDLWVGNLGGAVRNHAFIAPNPTELFDPVMQNATVYSMLMGTSHDTRHALIRGTDFREEMPNAVRHSRILPPDIAIPNNVRSQTVTNFTSTAFDPGEINAYEFAWGSSAIDVQNDGKPDLYWVGGLYGRGGGILSVAGTCPGRLMVNTTKAGQSPTFADGTASHQLFNIEELEYDELKGEDSGFVYRRSPKQNWGKRDWVYSTDRSSWVSQGEGVIEKVTHQDMIQASENGRAVVAADLNGDGFEDLIVKNKGGYDSRSSSASNLKVMVDGKPRALPAPDNNYPSITQFEPGRTWAYLNTYREGNWIKVSLNDSSRGGLNRGGIGD